MIGGGHFCGHLGYGTKAIFKLGQAFHKSCPYMKFGSKRGLVTKLECPQVKTDNRRQPFWQSSRLLFIGQNLYLNLGQTLIKAIHI